MNSCISMSVSNWYNEEIENGEIGSFEEFNGNTVIEELVVKTNKELKLNYEIENTKGILFLILELLHLYTIS